MRIILPALLMLGLGLPVMAAETPATSRDCLANRDIRAKRLSAGDGYFAQTRQGWWRNTGAVCPAFAKDRALVTRGNNDRQCSGDLVEVFDPFSRIGYGACVLGGWERVADAPPVSGRPQGR
nr:hypothetical protein [Polymorphobacter sp.]